MLRRGGIKEIARISLIPPLLNTTVKKTQNGLLRALATRTPSLGRIGQGVWELSFAQIGGAIFLVTLACLDISSKKRCL